MNDTKDYRLFLSLRSVLAGFVFLGLCVLYMQRVNMGIAILCMVNHTWVLNQTESHVLNKLDPNLNTSSSAVCYLEQKKLNLENGPFLWPKKTQGLILSSFFYGYFITQVFIYKRIPGGWLSLKFGGVKTFGFSILLGSITTILVPFAARQSNIWLIFIRFLTGLFHGPVFPALGSIWINWAPPNERSRILGLSTSGVMIGNIIALPLSGYLCVSKLGWESIFYIYGFIGILWSLMFMFFFSESPQNQKLISRNESFYILKSTKKSTHKPKNTPWGSIFRSKICWAINICGICFNWGSYLYITQIPSYIKDVLKFDVKSNGQFSSIPYISNWIIVLFTSFTGDYFLTNKILKKITIRRLYTSIAMFVPMVALIILSFVNCSTPYIGVALLTLGFAFNGCAGSAGFFINVHEIGGPYNSILVGIQNTFGTIPGFIGPYIIGIITKNHKQEEWKIVLWITSALYLFGCIIYLIFADVDIQPWAKHIEQEEEEELKKDNKILIEK